MAQPSPVHLPPYIKVLAFFDMDQDMISSVTETFMLACESLTNICIELFFLRAQGVLLRISCHRHILFVTKERTGITEFPVQR